MYASAKVDVEIQTLVDLLQARARLHPDRIVYTFLSADDDEPRSISYAELDQLAKAVAARLGGMNAFGERALMLYPYGIDFIIAFFGCLYAGVTCVPAYPPRKNQNLERLQSIINDCHPMLILSTAKVMSVAESTLLNQAKALKWLASDTIVPIEAEDYQYLGCTKDRINRSSERKKNNKGNTGDQCHRHIDGDTLAFLQYTSGSTGKPKGVMLTHRNLLENEAMIGEAYEFDSDTVWVSWLPLFHDLGLIGTTLHPFYSGATAVLMSPTSFLQKPIRWLQAISDHKAACSVAPNFAYDLCVKQITDEQKAGLDLSSWKWALSGAEIVRKKTMDEFSDRFADNGFDRGSFAPTYGLAEATLFVSGGGNNLPVTKQVSAKQLQLHHVVEATEAEAAAGSAIDIVGNGHPTLKGEIVIVNPTTKKPLADGDVGEIWVSGPHVANGYWDNAEETKRTFQAHLLLEERDDRRQGPYLRTGDLGSLVEGTLFITGREKEVIIIRGRNHYPQDIENTVQSAHDAFKAGAGAAFTVDADGEEQLVVVQELDRKFWRRLDEFLDKDEIIYKVRKAIAEKHELQLYSICFLKPGRILKTSSGKIKRRGSRQAYLNCTLEVLAEVKRESIHENLADKKESRSDRLILMSLDQEDRMPHLLRHLIEDIQSVVNIPKSVSLENSSLVGCGMDSILLVQLSSRLRESFAVDLQIDDLFDVVSIKDLAAKVLAQVEAGAQACERIPVSIQRTDIPLSYSQQRLWFIDQVQSNNTAYNLMVAMEIVGALQKELLTQAFEEIIARHEILRTVFCMEGGVPSQIVNESKPRHIAFEDLSSVAERAITTAIQGLATMELARPFDLEAGPLVRAKLLRLSKPASSPNAKGHKHVLLITAHHIVSDGWSAGIFVNELAAIYQSLLAHSTINLKKPAIQYKDFAIWQRQILTEEALASQVSYWRNQLAGAPKLELPSLNTRPPERSEVGADVHVTINAALTQKIKQFSRDQGATLFMVLLSSFNVLLHRYSGSDDICVGSPIASRTRAELENMVGFFVNTLALRNHCSGDLSFIQLLKGVRETTLDAYAHQQVPFERLVDELVGKRDLSYTPLFQVMFALQNTPLERANDQGDLVFTTIDVHTHTSKFDLTLTVDERDQGLKAVFEYSTDLFDDEYVRRLAAHWENLLQAIVDDPRQPISQLNLLGEGERYHLLEELNDNAGTFPRQRSLHSLFEEQVALTPNAIAVVYKTEQWTYSAINAKANQIARHLLSLGITAESLVAVSAERNTEMIIGLLAILKAGAAYVPLDPSYPEDRVAYMLEDAKAVVILCHHHLKERLPVSSAKIVCLDTDVSRWEGNDISNLAMVIDPSQLSYVIYTSGSTGLPKGVAIEHRNAAAMVQWALTVFHPRDLSGVLFSTSLCFDLSVWELFVTLSSGGKVIVVEDALGLPRLPAKNQVTLINTVPSAIASLLREGAIPNNVKMINLAGETLNPALVDSLYELDHVEKVYDLYGPSESTTYSTFMLRKPHSPASIGRPILNTATYVVDQSGQPLPKGIPGELYLSGWGIARGYLNRNELTSEKFIPNRFTHKDGHDRLYKTGDLVRYLSDGRLEFLGRIDHQVKVRGFRIELGEVEHALNRHEAVRESLVITREDGQGGYNLVAYWLRENHPIPTVADLRACIKETLPAYMLPAAFVMLDEFPLTPNGKLDREQLPEPAVIDNLGVEYAVPSTRLEIDLASIWREVLSQDVIGVNDDFFHLGGHSLLATQVVSRIRDKFKVELIVRDVFRAPTIVELARLIEGKDNDGGDIFPSIELADRSLPIPLSSAQQRLWFLDQLESGGARYKIGTAYNIAGAIKLSGQLNLKALKHAFDEVVKRHEILRTNIKTVDGQSIQVIGMAQPSYLDTIDLSPIDEPEQSWRVKALIVDEATRAFDIEITQNANRFRLLRTRLLKLAEHRYILLVTMHHIVSDGWSMGVLVSELVELYDALLNRRKPQLPELKIQYADYAVWQQNLLKKGVFDKQIGYWRQQLQAVPVLKLPTDRPRPPVLTSHGARVDFKFDHSLTSTLVAFSRQQGVTLFMLLLAGFNVLMHRYSHQNDFCVGTPIANRTRAELEPLIGCFVNTLALRTQFDDAMTVNDLLMQGRDVTLGAYAHQDLPFEVLVDELSVARDMSRSPLFQVMFTLQNLPVDYQVQLKGLGAELLPNMAQSAKFDISLNLAELDDQIRGEWEFNTDLFDRDTIEAMIGHYRQLLSNMCDDAQRKITDVRMLSREEEKTLTHTLVDVKKEFLRARSANSNAFQQDKCLHQLFEQRVIKNPEAVALTWNDEQLTYRQLNERANQLAHYIMGCGVGPNCLVGICLERSTDLIVSILAVMKAGGAYLPIDPNNPIERIAFILEDGLKGQEIQLVISHDAALDCFVDNEIFDHPFDTAHIANNSRRILNIDEHQALIEAGDKDDPCALVANSRDNYAYVIYTSGTTGKPKGVLIAHKQVTRLFSATDELYGFNESDVWSLFHSVAFDLTVWEMWGALLYGGRLVIVSQHVCRSPELFYELLRDEGVTVLNQTPSAFYPLIKADGERGEQSRPLALRYVIFGGEALNFAALQEWQKRHGLGHPRLVNMYGITETTVHATYHVVTESDLMAKASVIGRGIADLQIVLLDDCMRPVPVGVPGEIYVGGDGVAIGYLNRSELTEQRFIENPFSQGGRLYKSGDLARWTRYKKAMRPIDSQSLKPARRDQANSNSTNTNPINTNPINTNPAKVASISSDFAIEQPLVLEYLGRLDDQVKIRGYRIELGEIESTISMQASVVESVVIVREDEPGDKRLVAYIVTCEDGWDVATLRQALKMSLPDYMVPSIFVMMDALPVTNNGKIDKKKLPRPVGSDSLSIEYIAPRNDLERRITDIWCDVLGLSQIGIHDNFFDAGGNSLLATRVVSRIRDQFDVELGLSILFEQPTIEHVAIQVVEAEIDDLDDADLTKLLAELEDLEDDESE